MVDKTQYKEFRKDGWPFCPNCEDDELWSPGLLDYYSRTGEMPSINWCIDDGLQCYRCQWQSTEVKRKNGQLLER